MVLSLCVTSNAAYKDAADVDLNEAVDVLTAVGVLQGDESGNMNPKANLTREQAGKLVAYLQVGQKAADALVGGGKFTDVAKDRWSAGYVDYCASTGVVAGVGGGLFDPTGSLTALQFGKMLLVCLGYDAAIEGMTGTDWSINTSKLMSTANLLKGLDEVTANDVITREQAAKMMLNALKAPMVEYENKGSTIAVNGATIEFGASKANYVTTTIAKEQTISDEKLTNSGAYTIELGEKLFPKLVLTSDTSDAFARPAVKWTYKSEKIGTYAETPDLTYTEKVKSGKIYEDLGLDDPIAAKDVTVYINGVKVNNAIALRKGDSNKFGGQGTLTEVYFDDEAKTVIITEIVTYFGEVTAVKAATSSKDAYIGITGLSVGAPGDNYDTEAFELDDYVVYTYSAKDKEIKSVVKAESVTGTVTDIANENTDQTNANVTVDGTVYKASATSPVAETNEYNEFIDVECTVYLDTYGNAIYLIEEEYVSGDYALVLDIQAKNNTTLTSAATAQAVLLFTDGNFKKVDLAKDYGKGNAIRGVDDSTGADEYKNSIVTYKVNDDGEYVLKLVEQSKSFVAANDSHKSLTLKQDKALVQTGNGDFYANSKTVFVVSDKGDDTEWSVYTGIKNAPTITATGNSSSTAKTFWYCKSGNIATVVFTLVGADATVEDLNNDVLFVANDSQSKLLKNKDNSWYTYNTIIDGVVSETATKFEVATGAFDNATAKALDGFYKQYKMDDGFVVEATPADAFDGVDDGYINGVYGVNKTSEDYTVSFGVSNPGTSSEAYTYTFTVDEDAKVFYVNGDGVITESSYAGIQKDYDDEVHAIIEDAQVTYLVIEEENTKDNTTVTAATMLAGKSYAAASTSPVTVDHYAKVYLKASATITNAKDVTYTWYGIKEADWADYTPLTWDQIFAKLKTDAVKFDLDTANVNITMDDDLDNAPASYYFFCVIENSNANLDGVAYDYDIAVSPKVTVDPLPMTVTVYGVLQNGGQAFTPVTKQYDYTTTATIAAPGIDGYACISTEKVFGTDVTFVEGGTESVTYTYVPVWAVYTTDYNNSGKKVEISYTTTNAHGVTGAIEDGASVTFKFKASGFGTLWNGKTGGGAQGDNHGVEYITVSYTVNGAAQTPVQINYNVADLTVTAMTDVAVHGNETIVITNAVAHNH